MYCVLFDWIVLSNIILYVVLQCVNHVVLYCVWSKFVVVVVFQINSIRYLWTAVNIFYLRANYVYKIFCIIWCIHSYRKDIPTKYTNITINQNTQKSMECTLYVTLKFPCMCVHQTFFFFPRLHLHFFSSRKKKSI